MNQQEVVPPCALCQEAIEENEPKAELFCFHKVHTQCLQEEAFENVDDAFTCLLCMARQLHEGEQGENVEETEAAVEGPAHPEFGEPQIIPAEPHVNRLRTRDRIKLCFETHPEYKKDLRNYLKMRSEITVAYRNLTTSVLRKKEPFRAEILLLKNQIQEHIDRLKREVRQSQEFKRLRSKTSRFLALERKIEREFHEEFHEIRRAIQNERGFKRLASSWRLYWHSPRLAMRRAFYHHLRF